MSASIDTTVRLWRLPASVLGTSYGDSDSESASEVEPDADDGAEGATLCEVRTPAATRAQTAGRAIAWRCPPRAPRVQPCAASAASSAAASAALRLKAESAVRAVGVDAEHARQRQAQQG